MDFYIGKPQVKPVKASTRYYAKARPAPGGKGFTGQFSAVGLVPDDVKVNGKVAVFQTEEEAQLAAYQALEIVLNQRLQYRMRFDRVRYMSAAELSKALDDADLTPTELGNIIRSERVMGWLDGTHDIPHWLRLLVGLFKNPENISLAEKITDEASVERTEP